MKAAIHEKYGPPNVLYIRDVKEPTPKDNEVLIKVMATTFNRTDCAIISGKPDIMRLTKGLIKPVNQFSGTDFAGKIENIGDGVNSFKVGDKVFGFCDRGVCSHAQYMTISENKALAVMPDNTTFEQAAASTEGVHYAYNFINKVNINKGDKVLVIGATGAIGSAAIQLSKYYGADISAVCRRKDFNLVASLGANKLFDYSAEDFTSSNEKCNFVFDSVGRSSFLKCRPLLKPGGAYISSELGWMAQNVFFAIIKPVIGNKKVIFPFPSDIKSTITLIKKLIDQGSFKAVIDRTYLLEEIASAYEYVASGQKVGNVIINIASDS